MIGGAGSDTYVVDSNLDRVQERTGEGNDLVNANVSFLLPENVERLQQNGFWL